MNHHAHGAQKPLGVVAGDEGLGEDQLTLGLHRREDERGLHLGRGHGRVVGEATKGALAADRERGALALVAAVDLGAHQAKRRAHPAHRAAAQGGVSGEHGVERLPGEQAREQAHCGA